MYARRFSIEANFYNMKHHLHLTKESQYRCFDSTVAFNALCLLRLLILEWLHRSSSDMNTVGELFYQVREEQLSVPFKEAMSLLLQLFADLPDKLIASGLLSPHKRAQASALIRGEVMKLFGCSSEFIRDFMNRCGRTALLQMNRQARLEVQYG